jgi:4-amino-4-deoxy-L-arabinose transferase-like glycosyltransferase
MRESRFRDSRLIGRRDPVGAAFARRLAWIGLTVGLVAILFTAIRYPLLDPDEGRNAGVAREMRAAGEWIVPQFHGLPYLDKPILHFALMSASFAMFGKSETAARLPSILFALGTLAITWLFARRLVDARRGNLAIAVLATSPLFVLFARTVIFDMPLTFFVTGALWLAEEGRRGRRWGVPLAWVAIGLAVLTKGPIGLLLPILSVIALSIGRGRPYRPTRFFHPLGILLFILCIGPWVIAVEMRQPGFLRYALLVETVERLMQPTFRRTGPVWYYVPILLLGLFPWSIAVVARIPSWIKGITRGSLSRGSTTRGLFFAVAAIVLFFSISRSKLGGYVLPAFPLIAILVAGEIENIGRHIRTWSIVPGIVLLSISAIMIAFPLAGLPVGSWMKLPVDLAGAAAQLLVTIGVVCALAGATLLILSPRRRLVPAPFVLALAFPCMILASSGPLLRYVEENSSRAVATAVRARGGSVAAVRCFPPGLDYYLERVVPVVTDTGREITSTYIERNFDRILAGREGPVAGDGSVAGIWRPDDLSRRIAAGDPATRILITRRDDPPAPRYRICERIGGYRLWSADPPEVAPIASIRPPVEKD